MDHARSNEAIKEDDDEYSTRWERGRCRNLYVSKTERRKLERTRCARSIVSMGETSSRNGKTTMQGERNQTESYNLSKRGQIERKEGQERDKGMTDVQRQQMHHLKQTDEQTNKEDTVTRRKNKIPKQERRECNIEETGWGLQNEKNNKS